jgi:hypothetical protein
VIVATLGATTALSYALSGLVDWPLTALLVLGGAIGSAVGMRLGRRLADRRRWFEIGFACAVIAVGAFVLVDAL